MFLPFFNFLVFFIRVAGIINSIQTDSAWKTMNFTDECKAFAKVVKQDMQKPAAFIGKLRKVMDDADVYFQMAELGKVDAGGGGTIAYILANLDMNVIDSGIAVQNMHAPYEVISKADLYETLKGYEAFLQM